MLTYRTNPVFFLAVVAVIYLASAPLIDFAHAADVPTVQVRVCIPPQLVTDESWETPYPGSDMQAFRNTIRDYVAAHGGSGQIEYWISGDAFESFRAATAASYAPDPRALLREVSAQDECPPTNYSTQLEVDAEAPAPTTDAPAYPNVVVDDTPAPSADAAPEITSDSDDLGTVAGYVGVGAAAGVVLWCIFGGCSSSSSSGGDESSSYQYNPPPEDPINNPYQQYLDEQHNACVWSHTDVSSC